MRYGCNGCGYLSAQWLGFCPRCRDDSGLVESGLVSSEDGGGSAVRLVEVGEESSDHMPSGVGELDRVLGGGFVPGSVTLVAGEPGVGKSTLLLQVAASVAGRDGDTLVASGEESPQQIASRARRVGADVAGVHVLATDTVASVIGAADELKPALVVVDSIQTVAPHAGEPTVGSPSAVKAAAAELVGWAKTVGVPLVLIGHVNKDGAIAGPKVLEHVVDVVTHLDGDHHRDLRVFRCRKNRYGPTSRIGLFRLTAGGMDEVVDASRALVGGWEGDIAGSIAFPAVEGGRPMTVEIQALVAKTPSPQPRRSVRGIDSARLHQLLAVLERHGGLSFRGHDVYVGVSGGLRIREPAADLPVALALASSHVGAALGRIAAWGEVGLTGEVKAVPHGEWRAEESERLALSGFLAPADGMRRIGAVLATAGLT